MFLPPVWICGLPSGFWSHLSNLEAPGAEKLQAASTHAEPQGSTAAGSGNLADWAGMRGLCLSPGMQIPNPRGAADSYTE